MLAAIIRDGRLTVQERPDPTPGVREISVAVRSAGVNGADILQLRGRYPAPPGVPADIPGLEYAGEVVECGPAATRFRPGDRVMGLVGGGAQAELVVVDERTAMPVPAAMPWAKAGCLPEVFSTAFDALFNQAGLLPGERLLINGAAGGVGVAAIQLATRVSASVVATVRSTEMAYRVSRLGAHAVVAEAGSDAVAADGPFDVILELVGAPNVPTSLRCLARGGRLCLVGVGAGIRTEINVLELMNRRARIHGSTLRSETPENRAKLARQLERHVLPLFSPGALTVPVAGTFGLDQVAEAYERFAAGAKFGKIALIPNDAGTVVLDRDRPSAHVGESATNVD